MFIIVSLLLLEFSVLNDKALRRLNDVTTSLVV